QAEDGIRDKLVTGVQTCALPISATRFADPGWAQAAIHLGWPAVAAAYVALAVALAAISRIRMSGGELTDRIRALTPASRRAFAEIGRASCRERVWIWGGARACRE